MAEIAVGIDLGTSNSCVAVAHASASRCCRTPTASSVTASVVHFAETARSWSGNAAARR
jgi:molecular chaperone DnaK (HSP70)